MKRLALVLFVIAIILVVFVPLSQPVRAQDDPTSTPTFTPNPTETYIAAYDHFKTVADKNLPNVLVLAGLCAVIILAGVTLGSFAIAGRRR